MTVQELIDSLIPFEGNMEIVFQPQRDDYFSDLGQMEKGYKDNNSSFIGWSKEDIKKEFGTIGEIKACVIISE